jgi:hypothetical protein
VAGLARAETEHLTQPFSPLQKKDWEQMPLTNYRMSKYVGSGRYGATRSPPLRGLSVAWEVSWAEPNTVSPTKTSA